MAFNKVDSLEELQKEWRNPYIQWYAAGMPSFISQNGEPYKQLVLKFRSKEDRAYFGEAMGYKVTDKTNVVWYPHKNSEKNKKKVKAMAKKKVDKELSK